MVSPLNNALHPQSNLGPNSVGMPPFNSADSRPQPLEEEFPQDRVTLSAQQEGAHRRIEAGQPSERGERALSEEEQALVRELKQRDQEVRAHEQAHIAAGGGLVQGGASYQFERGPDGRMYAVGGEVSIDTSRERDPDQTIRKMQQVKRAALAPTDPSATDKGVAARAAQIETQARMEKMQARMVEAEERQAGGQTAPLPLAMGTYAQNPLREKAASGGRINLMA